MTVTLPETYPAYATDFVIPNKLTRWLGDIVDYYAEKNIPLPERRYWTVGETAHDCEQAVLAVQQMILGTAENPMEVTHCNSPRAITFTFEVIRCVPGLDSRGRPPEAQEIEDGSVDIAIDMEMMLDLARIFPEFNSAVMVTVDPISPSSKFAGAIATYTVDV